LRNTGRRKKRNSRLSKKRSVLPVGVTDTQGSPNAHGSQHTSGNKQAEEQAEKDTEKKLSEIQQIGKKTGPKVVDDLLKAVLDVKPVVPDRVEQPIT
jgi:hypothetical protein